MLIRLLALIVGACKEKRLTNDFMVGGSPGLVVMGVDSCSIGRGFVSRRRILDGHDIFHIHL